MSILRQAEEAAHAIDNTLSKAEVLRMLALALAQAKQWEWAEEMTHSIQDVREKNWVLRDLVQGLAQVGDWERAEEMAYMIEDDSSKTQALSSIVQTLAQAEQWERLVQFTQRTWFLTETRTCALDVFLLVLPLLKEHPFLDHVLIHSFEWVNAFFVGDF